jgi:acyl carrier protein
VREIVGSVLRVKPDSLRDDQPLTDLGLDSLMGAEIENSLESAIGVGLPPTSLMRARTVSQIAALIADHMGGVSAAVPSPESPPAETARAEEVDVDALSNDEIDKLLEAQAGTHEGRETEPAQLNRLPKAEAAPWLKTDERV